jgi:EAL domain-containing protein (putative c-di-GMP-specific phosphodiesterase class I)
MSDPARALETLSRLRRLGVGIAVDDFGTGHSSLAYLARLPIDEIKIDRSFVRDLVRNRRNEAIVRSTIVLAHDLGYAVVAEGVEDQATWERLGALGCDLLQGYHISRPLPAGEIVRWLDAWTGRQGLRPAA